MKRLHILPILAVLTLLLCGILPTRAEAATEGYYTVTNGEATITDVDSSIGDSITIPAALGGYPVTGIGENAFSKCKQNTDATYPFRRGRNE